MLKRTNFCVLAFVIWTYSCLAQPANASEPVFGSTFNLSNNAAVAPLHQEMAVSGSNVYIVWTDGSGPTSSSLFFRASNDNGTTFGPLLTLAGPGTISNPQVAVSGNHVYVVWGQYT